MPCPYHAQGTASLPYQGKGPQACPYHSEVR